MCYFVTVAVPCRFADCVGEMFGRGYQLSPSRNTMAAEVLPRGFTARYVTSCGCSCDLYIPEDAGTPTAMIARRERLVRKNRKQWSERKRTRALEQQAAHWERRADCRPGLAERLIEPLIELCEATQMLSLFVHWSDGGVDTERLLLTKLPTCASSELSVRLRELREGEVLSACA